MWAPTRNRLPRLGYSTEPPLLAVNRETSRALSLSLSLPFSSFFFTGEERHSRTWTFVERSRMVSWVFTRSLAHSAQVWSDFGVTGEIALSLLSQRGRKGTQLRVDMTVEGSRTTGVEGDSFSDSIALYLYDRRVSLTFETNRAENFRNN